MKRVFKVAVRRKPFLSGHNLRSIIDDAAGWWNGLEIGSRLLRRRAAGTRLLWHGAKKKRQQQQRQQHLMALVNNRPFLVVRRTLWSHADYRQRLRSWREATTLCNCVWASFLYAYTNEVIISSFYFREKREEEEALEYFPSCRNFTQWLIISPFTFTTLGVTPIRPFKRGLSTFPCRVIFLPAIFVVFYY